MDGKKFYYIDSLKFRVDVYDFDAKSGSISNKRTFFDLKKNNLEGVPDGMTIDVRGHLYVCNFTAFYELFYAISHYFSYMTVK